MNLPVLKRIFSSTSSDADVPLVRFGRFSDSYKEKEKYAHWDAALASYEAGSYLDAFEYFLQYLSGANGNIHYERTDDQIRFELYQGSKKVTGIADQDQLIAGVKIAKTDAYHLDFLKKLTELNHQLKFSRFSIDEDGDIAMSFYSSVLDGSPYKLYHGLKELAIYADKQDDILVSDFAELASVNTDHIEPISPEIKDSKLNFYRDQLQSLFDDIESSSLDWRSYPGGLSYLILSVVYKLDYLIAPEGKTMQAFEEIHHSFFHLKKPSPYEKNQKMISILQSISRLDRDQFYEELYQVKSTFGVMAPTAHRSLVKLVNTELPQMDWYIKDGHPRVALAIPEYIVGYSLYSFALPMPTRALLELYYCVMHSSYFGSMGYTSVGATSKSRLSKKPIINQMKRICKRFQSRYSGLSFRDREIDYSEHISFARSYLLAVANMNIKAKKL